MHGARLHGKGVLRRMAPASLSATVAAGQPPGVTVEEQVLDALPTTPTLPPFSISIYELPTHPLAPRH